MLKAGHTRRIRIAPVRGTRNQSPTLGPVKGGALRRITDENTSRVHVLVLREGPIVYAYDLASTQGTYNHGEPARRVVLYDGASLTLGRGDNAVRMHWHPQR